MTGSWIKRAAMILCALALAISVGGCGKKGDLESPDGKKSEYPRTYPR